MAADNAQASFRRGVMSLVILALLKREDMYGYQICQLMEEKSDGRFTILEGSLYLILYKLVEMEYLTTYTKVQVGKRMTRVYYHLEPTGEARLLELIREYEETAQGVFQIIREEGDTDGQS